MSKNVQTAGQLHSFHMLARFCSKSFKLGFSSTWTENFQMYQLGLEKAEKQEIRLSTFVGSWRKQGSFRKTSASSTTLKPLTVWITTNWKILKEVGIPDHLPISWEATVRTRHGTTDWFKIVNGGWQGYILSPCLFNLYEEYNMRNARLDESGTSWNHSC